MGEDSSQGFRVIDKRRFTESGSSRESDVESQEAEAQEVEGQKARQVTDSSAASQAQEQSKAQETARDAHEEARAQSYAPVVDFSSFAVSLATQAMMMLGEIPQPDSGSLSINLDAARQTIDILGMLEEKTRGNLTGQEEQLMAEILSSLRMAYVAKRKER